MPTRPSEPISGLLDEIRRALQRAGEPRLATTVDRLREVLADAIADNPGLARALSDLWPPRLQDSSKSRLQGGRRPPGPFDPFAVFAEGGESALRERLSDVDIEQLKDIIAEHAMDHDRLAMRWKTSDRLIDRIVETVEARARKGSAFR